MRNILLVCAFVIAEAIQPGFWFDRPWLTLIIAIIMSFNILLAMGDRYNENSNTNSGGSDS